MKHRLVLIILPLVVAAGSASAGWKEWLDKAQEYVPRQQPGATASSVSRDEAVAALREALVVGSRRAVELLAREGGYLDDAQVRIPMPELLTPLDKGLRALGQGRVVDAFVTSLNRAAERAAPQAAGIFADAVGRMSVEDAWAILNGGDDAATRYFREQTEGPLGTALLPVVRDATAQARVTSAYKGLLAQAGPYLSFVDPKRLDLDGYVTEKALDGLFTKLAAEELRIRREPLARSSELLQKVFAAVAR